MSIDADTIRLIADAGGSTDDLCLVAKAGESGPDQASIVDLIGQLRFSDCPPAAIAIAVMALAEKIIENRKRYRYVGNDNAPTARCGNRQRRGMSDTEWRKLRQIIFERDNFACTYCGSGDDLTCDHVVPLIRGGGNDHDNLTTACRPCNSSKGDKLLEEWVA